MPLNIKSFFYKSFLKKIYFFSILVAFVLVSFIIYSVTLADRSIVNLRIVLEQLQDAKTIKEINALEPLLDNLIFAEFSKDEHDMEALEIIEFAKNIASQLKKKEQISDLRFIINELNKRKRTQRNIFLYGLDTISSVIEPSVQGLRKFILRLKADNLTKEITLVSIPSLLQKLRFARGVIYMDTQEFKKAADDFDMVCQLDSDSPLVIRAKFRLACIYRKQKDFDTARSLLEGLIKDYPLTQIALESECQTAGIWQQLNSFDKAQEAYESLPLKYPKNDLFSLIWCKVGYNYIYFLKDYQKFLQVYNDRIKTESPKSPWARYVESIIVGRIAAKYRNLGFKLLLARRYEEALSCFAIALKITPKDGSCYTGQSLAYFWLGDKEKALEMAKIGKDLSPDEELTVVNLGFIYIHMGLLSEAIGEYKKFLESKQSSKEAHFNLGYIYTIIYDIDSAIHEFQKSAEIDYKFSAAYNNIGYLFWYKEKYANAIGEFKKAIRADPNCLEAHFNLGFAFKMLGRLTEAKEEFEEVLRLDPTQKMALQHLRELEDSMSIKR